MATNDQNTVRLAPNDGASFSTTGNATNTNSSTYREKQAQLRAQQILMLKRGGTSTAGARSFLYSGQLEHWKIIKPQQNIRSGLGHGAYTVSTLEPQFFEVPAGPIDAGGAVPLGGAGASQGKPDLLPPPNPEWVGKDGKCRDNSKWDKRGSTCYFNPKTREERCKYGFADCQEGGDKLPPPNPNSCDTGEKDCYQISYYPPKNVPDVTAPVPAKPQAQTQPAAPPAPAPKPPVPVKRRFSRTAVSKPPETPEPQAPPAPPMASPPPEPQAPAATPVEARAPETDIAGAFDTLPKPEFPARPGAPCRVTSWYKDKSSGLCYATREFCLAEGTPGGACVRRKQNKLSGPDNARNLFKKKDYAGSIAAFGPLASKSSDPVLVSQYAYALAHAGFTELALAQLDRAYNLDGTNPEVLFHASEVLKALGLKEAAEEIARPAPEWLRQPNDLGDMEHERVLGDFSTELAAAEIMLDNGRYVSASDRFARITEKYPNEPLGWTGLAIALENLGAYKAAAKAVAQDILLSGDNVDQATKDLMEAHRKDLESHSPLETPPPPSKPGEYLKGRYLVFFGGSYNHTETDSTISLNTRLGRFFTNRLDAGLTAGYIGGYKNGDYNGINFGISGRYHQPLPLPAPLQATGGVRLEYMPGPKDKFTFILTPGLSYLLGDGSLDLYVDFALSGPMKKTQTLSLGYTIFFGGSKK